MYTVKLWSPLLASLEAVEAFKEAMTSAIRLRCT